MTFTKEVLEHLSVGTTFNDPTIYRGYTVEQLVPDLASTLLAEMDKPKVWDGAPENAVIAQVHFYKAAKTYATPSATPMVYTRERPKSRAREIAEEERKRALGEAKAIIDIADYVEAGILKREAELRGES
jgi:hypothetical protein